MVPSTSTYIEVVVHDLSDKNGLSEDARNILQLLNLPLPQDLANESELLPRLSPGVRELYLDDVRSISSLSDVKRPLERPGRPVTDILDLLLATVQRMSDARRCVHGLVERWRCWSAILATCGLAMPGIAHISEEISVTLPRTQPRSEAVELGSLERTAATMLSCWIPRRHLPKKEPAPRGSNSEASGYDHSSTESTSDASNESFVTLDYPLDAYITPGTGKRVDCRFPVVCAGNEDDIQDLITSIVCQRYVWGLPTTVVGLSLPKKGTHASLVVGWMQMKEADSDASPVVHLAVPSQPTSAGLPLGIFDASDAQSALRFAQFILDLQPLFSTIKSALIRPTLKDFCWKAEHVHFHDPISKPESSFSVESRVTTWLQTLPFVETPDASAFPTDQDSPPLMASRKATTQSGTSNTSKRLQVPTINTPSEDRQPVTKKDAAAQTRFSCSAFGKKGDNDIQGIRTYLADRRTIPLLLLRRRSLQLLIEEQINEFHDLYEEHTSFLWPAEWNTLASLPPCDKALERFRADLFKNFQRYKEQQKAINLVNLNDSAISVIVSRMSTCMHIVAQAELSRFNTLDGIIIESGTRVPWDQGMKAGCCVDPDVPLSRSFFVERLIRLAVNQAASEGAKFNPTDHAELASQLAGSQLFAAQATKIPSLVKLARAEVNLTTKHVEVRTKPITLGDRAYEPHQGVIDGAYCLRYDPEARGATKPSRKPVAEDPSEAKWFTAFRNFFHSGEPSSEKCKHQHPVTLDADVTEETPVPDEDKVQGEGKDEDDKTSPCLCSEATRSLYDASSSPVTARVKQQLLIPFILNEYKRDLEAIHQAYNQVRMYCVSAVEFLASIGVTDYPVWGVVAAGNQGAIVMAWKSTTSWTNEPGISRAKTRGQTAGPSTNFIFDRNAKTFDLSDPLQAYHFLTCIHRIHRLQDKLREKLDASHVRQKLEDKGYQNWMSAIPPKEDKTDAKKK